MSNAGNVTESANASDQSLSLRMYFVTEIQSMMHGFGDAQEPLFETACLVENVVQEQMKQVISQGSDIAEMRGNKCMGPEEIIFLLRKDRVKLHRLLKYLSLKDMKNNMSGILGDSTEDPELMLETSASKKRSRLCMDFLNSIDQTGELTQTNDLPVDVVKHERIVRAERSSRVLDDTRYLEFVQARRTSFVSNKSAAKFRDWLQIKPEATIESPKILTSAYDLLGYLAYETVAQLVDMALLVRQDKQLRPGEPLSRYMPGIGYSTRHNLDARQIETASPLTVAEVREGMRRFWHSPVGLGIAFSRTLPSELDSRLLCM